MITKSRARISKFAGLFGAIAFAPAVPDQLAANGGLAPIEQPGNLGLIVSGFHEGVNLISFGLAEVFVIHGQLRLAGQKT